MTFGFLTVESVKEVTKGPSELGLHRPQPLPSPWQRDIAQTLKLVPINVPFPAGLQSKLDRKECGAEQ